jgi:hypothetical protein
MGCPVVRQGNAKIARCLSAMIGQSRRPNSDRADLYRTRTAADLKWSIGIEAAKGVECDPQIGGGHVVSQEVDRAAPLTRNCRRFTRDFKSEAGLVMLRSPNEAVIDAAGNDESKHFTIGCGSVCFKGLPRCLKAIPERRECLAGEYRVCGSVLRNRLRSEMIAKQIAVVQRISGGAGDQQHRPNSDINRRGFSGIAENEIKRQRHCSVLIASMNGAERIGNLGINTDPGTLVNLHNAKLAAYSGKGKTGHDSSNDSRNGEHSRPPYESPRKPIFTNQGACERAARAPSSEKKIRLAVAPLMRLVDPDARA